MGVGARIGWTQASAAGPLASQGSAWSSAAVPQPQSAPPRLAPVIPLRPPGRAGLSILYTGQMGGTCMQRADALRDLGHDVVFVPSGHPPTTGSLKRVLAFQLYRVLHHLKRHPDTYLANFRLLRWARRRRFDLVWIDKGVSIRPRTLRRLKRLLPGVRIIAYSPDDMFNPVNQSQRYLDSIALYDLHVTTKSFNVQELEEQGARDVMFVENAYDPSLHKSMLLSPEDRQHLSADVGFVGVYEEERGDLMLRLAENGIPVTVRGPGWARFGKSHPALSIHDEYLDAAEYPKAVNATRINLGFLRRANRDVQTQRSIEIPACGGFMLAERTDEHARLFEEGVEAEYFDCFEELLAKCRHYLDHEAARERIARRGQQRCVTGRYSNQGRLAPVLDRALRNGPADRAKQRFPAEILSLRWRERRQALGLA